jgi:hypothetical protein
MNQFHARRKIVGNKTSTKATLLPERLFRIWYARGGISVSRTTWLANSVATNAKEAAACRRIDILVERRVIVSRPRESARLSDSMSEESLSTEY